MNEGFYSSPDMMGKELEIENSLGDYRNKELGLKSEIEFTQAESVESIESKGETFGGVTLKKDGTYEVPGISKQAKNLKHKQFPGVIFGNCRLSRKLGSVLYTNALVIPLNGKTRMETHKETFYSQKVLPGGALKIPGRHVAEDGTVRDKDGYICVAANYIPKGSVIMTTLGPGKVYDTGEMKGNHIDIYVNW